MHDPRESTHDSPDYRNALVSMFVHGIDRIADIQKRTIDIAAQHNAEMMDIYKKSVQKLPPAFRLPFVEVANTMFERFSEVEKHAIDLTVEQSHTLLDSVKERVANTDKVTESAVSWGNQAVDRSVAAQKKVLETAVAQTKAAMDATRQQIGPTDAAINSFQRGVEKIFEAQKEMLDLAAK